MVEAMAWERCQGLPWQIRQSNRLSWRSFCPLSRKFGLFRDDAIQFISRPNKLEVSERLERWLLHSRKRQSASLDSQKTWQIHLDIVGHTTIGFRVPPLCAPGQEKETQKETEQSEKPFNTESFWRWLIPLFVYTNLQVAKTENILVSIIVTFVKIH